MSERVIRILIESYTIQSEYNNVPSRCTQNDKVFAGSINELFIIAQKSFILDRGTARLEINAIIVHGRKHVLVSEFFIGCNVKRKKSY